MGDLIYKVSNDSTSKLLSFRSLMETPLESLICKFSPKQSGTGNATPTNPRTIVGRNSITIHRCGINLLKCTGHANGTSQGVKRTFHLNENNEVDELTLAGTTTSANAFYNFNYVANQIHVFNGKFAMYGYSNQANLIISGGKTYYTTTNKKYNTISADWNIWNINTSGQTQAWVRMQIVPYVKGTVVDTKLYPMMCLPQDKGCEFEPYYEQDIIYNLNDTYYGGFVDVVQGIILQDWYELNPLTLSDPVIDNETTNNITFHYSNLPYDMMSSTLISNHFNINETNSDTSGYMYGSGTELYLTISKELIGDNTVSAFKTWLNNNPTQICYQMYTPIGNSNEGITVNAWQGRNNMWTDDLDELQTSYKLYESTFIQKAKQRALTSVPHTTTILSGNTEYSSDVAHFTTTTEKTIRLLQVALTPIQEGSGEPSPSNIRTITGHSSFVVRAHGKNFLRRAYYHEGTNPRTINQVVFTVNNDGSVTADGTASSVATYYFSSRTSNTWIMPLGQFTLNGRPSQPKNNSNLRIGWNHGSVSATQGNDVGAGTTVNITDGFGPLGSWASVGTNQTASNYTFYPMLRLNCDNSDYEPYTGQTFNVNLTNIAGTVYGGTVDIISGVIKVKYILETLTWGSNYILQTTFTNNELRRFSLTNNTVNDSSISLYPSLCNIAPFSYDTITDSIHQFVKGNKAYICLPKTTSSDTSIQICYKLQTPIIYNLTPNVLVTQQGINNIWSTDGSLTIKY